MLNDASGFQKIYVATGYTDLRRGMEGLANIIRFRFHLDPYDRNTLFALSYYMEYLSQQELELIEVGELGYEEQNRHFVQFLYWLLEGRHLEKHRKQSTGKGTCNAYLKSVLQRCTKGT